MGTGASSETDSGEARDLTPPRATYLVNPLRAKAPAADADRAPERQVKTIGVSFFGFGKWYLRTAGASIDARPFVSWPGDDLSLPRPQAKTPSPDAPARELGI